MSLRSNYDDWLEAPYQRAAAESDAFIHWCENNNVDPDADDAWDTFQGALDDAMEAAVEARAEAMREGV